MGLTDRKKKILKVVVENYIHTAEPVDKATDFLRRAIFRFSACAAMFHKEASFVLGF